MLSLIPAPYKFAAGGLVLAVVGGLAYYKGSQAVHREWDAQKQADVVSLARLKDSQTVVSSQIDTRHQEVVERVRTVYKTITSEVKVYVPTTADSACIVPNGFVLLHDAAAKGDVPAPPGESDAAPAGVELSTVAATVAENYGTYAEIRQRLIDLQAWVTAQENINR